MNQSTASNLLLPLARHKLTAITLSIGAACVLANGMLSKRAVRGKKKAASWDWDKEIVVVTGGSSGIGKELVDGFSRRGVTVVSLDIKPPSPVDAAMNNVSNTTKDASEVDTSSTSHHYHIDVSSCEALHDVGQRIRNDLGGNPTVLINNAGLAVGIPLLHSDEQTVRAVFDVNMLSHFWTVFEFLPAMIERDHGHIVSVGSVASYVTLASNIEYSCTKAGVLAFHEGLGQELKHRYGARSVLTR